MKKFRSLITVLAVILFWTILDFFGVFKKFEFRFYDLLLLLKAEPKASPELLLVEADNLSLENIGPWPWKRDVYANLLMRMKELGAKTAVFDIEFLSPSNFPEADEYFANSIQFFDNTFLTINTFYLDINYSLDELKYSSDRFLLDTKGQIDSLVFGNNVTRYESQKNSLFGFSQYDWTDKNVRDAFSIGLSPTKHQFISRAKGAGFTNVIIDSDGVRRRVELLDYQQDFNKSVGQLIFAPLITQIQPEQIIRNKKKYYIKKCNLKRQPNRYKNST